MPSSASSAGRTGFSCVAMPPLYTGARLWGRPANSIAPDRLAMLEVRGVARDIARRIDVAELAPQLHQPLPELRFLARELRLAGEVAILARVGGQIVQFPRF